jgi:tricorn protease
MIGELCCSHTYTGGGDMPRMESSQIGLLGCDFTVDTQYNAIRIARILKGENWDESLRSPLEEPGIAVSEGDYILAINGQELGANVNPYSLTQQTIGQHVTLTVNHAPTLRGAREVQVRPVASEGNLRYFNWVEDRKAYVDSVSDGQIGYIHIPDMGGFGLTRFTKMFYHQMKRPGLIIDVRYNGGGFVSGLILDRLRKTLVAMGGSRTFPEDRAPGNAIYAHMITLLNQQSCSDGDYFPYFFREYGLGPLMGVRSWGGVIGIRGGNSFTDGGYCTVPEFGLYDLEGNWTMENEGVHPDMVVENLPTRMAQNFDDQLDAALEYIQNRLAEDPKTLPSVNGPPAPR